MQLSVNESITDRSPLFTKAANHNFKNMKLSAVQLAASINLGHAFCAQLSGKRCSANFVAAGFLAIDIDEGLTLEEALQMPFVKQYASIVYTTTRHRKEGFGDRYRIVFELENPITDAVLYRRAICGLLKQFPMADQACKDVARVYRGSSGSNPQIFERKMPDEIVQKLIQEGEPTKSARRQAGQEDFPLEEAKKMLSFIDPQPGYDVWRNIVWAAANTYGDDAISLIEEWSPDDKHAGRHLEELVSRADGRVTLGTVIHYAQKGGYTLPLELLDKRAKRKRTPGQVALEDLFSGGVGLACIGTELYQYDSNEQYYKPVLHAELEKAVSEYFYDYQTDGHGRTVYATPNKVKEACLYIKQKTFISQERVNSAGVNVRNGYLRLRYTASGDPCFELLPHRMENVFTYCSRAEYKPDASSEAFDKAMNDILPPVQQEILFRILGSSLDLQMVRQRQGRAIRALILLGEGSNGKDTLREWLSLIYAGQGLTSVPMQAFRAADKESQFNLHPLSYSRVNWCSENDMVSLDRSQTLKNVITGDEITVEKKHEQGFPVRPRTILLFNVNEPPIIKTKKEAISSRYAMLLFESTFTANPDPHNPKHKRIDPRFKEDPAFIESTILPAFLNRMIQGFVAALKEGIDYSGVDGYLDELRRDNSHLMQFIEALGLVPCDPKDGIQSTKLYGMYRRWCTDEEYMKPEALEADIHPHEQYDKLVRHPNQLYLRLKEIIPNLQKSRVAGRTLIGLKQKK